MTKKHSLIIVLFALNWQTSFAQSGLSTFDGAFVTIPSVKVNENIHNNVSLTFLGEGAFNVKSADDAIVSSEPAAAIFDGARLLIRNLVYEAAQYSNIELKFEGNLDFSLVGADIPKPIATNSYLNRKSDLWLNYWDFGHRINGFVYVDIDNDGDDDIFVARFFYPSAGVEYTEDSIIPEIGELYKNDSGSFNLDTTTISNMPSFDFARKAVTAELNGDSYPDIVVADHGYDASPFPGAYVHLLLSQIDGTYKSKTINVQGFHHGVAAGDLDGDGDIDLLTVRSGLGMLNDGKGNFELVNNFRNIISDQMYTIEIYDLNNDGYNEIITTGHTYVTPTKIFLGDSTYSYSEHFEIAPTDPYFGVGVDIGVEDLDNDGKPELILSKTSGPDPFYEGYEISAIKLSDDNAPLSSYVLHSNKEQSWVQWLRYEDVNADGLLDIANDNKGFNFVLINQGNLVFEKE